MTNFVVTYHSFWVMLSKNAVEESVDEDERLTVVCTRCMLKLSLQM